MSVRRDRRTDRWYFRARVTHDDGRRTRLYGTPGVSGPYHDLPNTKAGAQAAEARAITHAMTGQLVRPEHKEVPTIRDYVAEIRDTRSASHKPSSKRDAKQRLEHDILPAVGDLRLSELRQQHVDEISEAMLDRDCSRKTVNNSLGALSAIVKYAVANGVIAKCDLRFFIKAQDAEVDAVAGEDVSRLVDAAPDDRYRVAVLLAADAGLRVGEIRALPWIDVNEVQRELAIAASYDRAGELAETKSMRRRVVPIGDRLWAALSATKRRGPLVFSRLDGDPLGYDAAKAALDEMYKASGVRRPQQPWHGLRHTYGTELAARGVPVTTIQELMGHSDIKTTLRYVHVTREQKRAAVALLGSSGSQWAAASKTATK